MFEQCKSALHVSIFFVVCIVPVCHVNAKETNELKTDKYGIEKSDSIHKGAVIIDDEYIKPPYVIARKGLVLTINDRIVIDEFVKDTTSQKAVKDPKVPESIDRDSRLEDIENYLDEKYDYLSSKYKDKKLYDKYINVVKNLPCVKEINYLHGSPRFITIELVSGESKNESLGNMELSPAEYPPQTKINILQKWMTKMQKHLRAGGGAIFYVEKKNIDPKFPLFTPVISPEKIIKNIKILRSNNVLPSRRRRAFAEFHKFFTSGQKSFFTAWIREIPKSPGLVNSTLTDKLPLKWDRGMAHDWTLKYPTTITERGRGKKTVRVKPDLRVVATPQLIENAYVLRLTLPLTEKRLFFTLRQKDLSLREYRKTNQEIFYWKQADLVSRHPGGVPVIIETETLRMAFPVFTTKKEICHRQKNGKWIVQHLEKVPDSDPAKYRFTFARAKDKESAREQLRSGNPDYEIIWEHGEDWWNSCTAYDKDAAFRIHK